MENVKLYEVSWAIYQNRRHPILYKSYRVWYNMLRDMPH
jgi:hypothetical protein